METKAFLGLMRIRNTADQLLAGLTKRKPDTAATISEQLRNVIRDCGKSVNQLAKESGVPQPMITRFLNGQELRSGTMDRLAGHLGLSLVKGGKRK